MKKALEVGKDLREPTKEVEVFPGVYVSNMTFEDVVRRSMKDSTLYYLVEDGRPITEIEFPQNPASSSETISVSAKRMNAFWRE